MCRKFLRSFPLVLVIGFAARVATPATLHICNNAKGSMYFAVGWQVAPAPSKGTSVRGWYAMAPNECKIAAVNMESGDPIFITIWGKSPTKDEAGVEKQYYLNSGGQMPLIASQDAAFLCATPSDRFNLEVPAAQSLSDAKGISDWCFRHSSRMEAYERHTMGSTADTYIFVDCPTEDAEGPKASYLRCKATLVTMP
jgi:hypothetical protein